MKASLAIALACAVGSAALATPALDSLRASAAAHPEDGAVARALAASLLSEGASAEAVAVLRAHLVRNPEQGPACAQVLGRALLAEGDLVGARAALTLAIAHREQDATAHLYLGLTELRLGDGAAAARHMARAQALDPRLAERVRAASQPQPGLLGRALSRISLSAGAGAEYDTNSTLEGDEGVTALAGDRADSRFRYDAALAVKLLRGDRADLVGGYRIEENDHRELEMLDVQSHGLFLASTVALSPSAYLRVDGGAALHRLDDHTHLRSASLGSGVGWLSERRGAVELKVHAERRAFEDAPALPSLERDGWRCGGILSHALPAATIAPGSLTTQLRYARTLTEGSRDPFGLGPAFDSHLAAIDSGLFWPLPAKLALQVHLGLGLEDFDSRNVVDFLSDDGAGDPSPERRRDYAVEAGVTLSRPISRWLELQLRFRETRRFSNVDVYDWDRQIIGTQLRLRWSGP